MKVLQNVVIVICFLFLTVEVSNAQDQTRTLEHGKYRKYDIKTEPIAVVGRRLGDKPFINESQAEGGTDWLRDLTLVVKNISSKPIVRFVINLNIDKQGSMPHNAAMAIYFSAVHQPVVNSLGKPTGEYHPSKPLLPGETVEVKVAKHHLRILDEIKKYDVVDIGSVSMNFSTVVFEDRSGWFQGIETREDPNRPGSQIPVRPR